MDKVEKLSAESTLPKKVDRNFWDRFIIKSVSEYYETFNKT